MATRFLNNLVHAFCLNQLGFGVWGSGFGDLGLASRFGGWAPCRAKCAATCNGGRRFAVLGLGFEVLGLGFKVLGLGFDALVLGFGVSGLGSRLWGAWALRGFARAGLRCFVAGLRRFPPF